MYSLLDFYYDPVKTSLEYKSNLKKTLPYAFFLFVFPYVLGIGTLVIISLLYLLIADILIDPKILFNEYIETLSENTSDYYVLISSILIAPVLEELMFRYGLSFKKKHIIVSISTFIAFQFFGYQSIYNNPNKLFLPVIVFLCFYIVLNKIISQKLIDKYISNYKNITVYIVSFLFGLIHILNFESLEFNFIPFYIIYVLILSMIGLVLSFIRMSNGLYLSIIFHSLFNLM